MKKKKASHVDSFFMMASSSRDIVTAYSDHSAESEYVETNVGFVAMWTANTQAEGESNMSKTEVAGGKVFSHRWQANRAMVLVASKLIEPVDLSKEDAAFLQGKDAFSNSQTDIKKERWQTLCTWMADTLQKRENLSYTINVQEVERQKWSTRDWPEKYTLVIMATTNRQQPSRNICLKPVPPDCKLNLYYEKLKAVYLLMYAAIEQEWEFAKQARPQSESILRQWRSIQAQENNNRLFFDQTDRLRYDFAIEALKIRMREVSKRYPFNYNTTFYEELKFLRDRPMDAYPITDLLNDIQKTLRAKDGYEPGVTYLYQVTVACDVGWESSR
jgi:hypothetical protein